MHLFHPDFLPFQELIKVDLKITNLIKIYYILLITYQVSLVILLVFILDWWLNIKLILKRLKPKD